MIRKQLTTEEREARDFLNFVDRVALALYGKAYEDCSPSQRKVVLAQVESLHDVQVN